MVKRFICNSIYTVIGFLNLMIGINGIADCIKDHKEAKSISLVGRDFDDFKKMMESDESLKLG